MSTDAKTEKRALRADTRQRRRSHGELLLAERGEQISLRLQQLVAEHGATRISCYLSGEFEPSTRPFLAWAGAADITVLLPVTREDGLLDWVVSDGQSERPHELGFPEATGDLLGPIALGDADLLIIPAASVDLDGYRMGWGRGYFDRTLGSMAGRPPVYAVVYDDELLEVVPREAHDERVDGVVTPSGIRRF
ncbi:MULTISPECIES: 5-formyltetrahydrofolate cyclo-ligase [unclassified Pseudoclavibacter]|uniref:5-formyltetrahydrofolate cyclo-ligase n=1 Tax=unclassified Pseudoclavibacter TaxID=2615177 RepID=UPI000CE82015|nr:MULTISPECIES: 5-formyltetrahydrofolate cyclo-ligase [unclassified Pseudoclavibacter]PPF38316.1 5-formyltetrahydrofolate cyclo-ligase [Pseudoclavibacter sp. AY1H1]PPF76342.1 5-formyltetrahydrofolate cyclo-ligase [Pseudoclavibacter sp. Z016]